MSLRKAFVIAGVNLRRLLRDKTGAFFIFVFPFLIILALGAAFGSGFTPTLGVVMPASAGALGQDLRGRFEATEDLNVRTFADADALRTAVEHGEVEGGLVIPAGYDEQIRAGATVPLTYIARPGGSGTELQIVVSGVVDEQSVAVRAARFAVSEGAAAGFTDALTKAEALAVDVPDGRRRGPHRRRRHHHRHVPGRRRAGADPVRVPHVALGIGDADRDAPYRRDAADARLAHVGPHDPGR